MFKRKIFVILYFFMSLESNTSNAQITLNDITLIPTPASLEIGNGDFKINSSTSIQFSDDKMLSDIEIFIDFIKRNYGIKLHAEKSSEKKNYQINIFLSNDIVNDGYQLSVNSDGVFIEAGNGAGVFYALQSMGQLIQFVNTDELHIQNLKIKDWPRFSYRGMHLDVSRHFFLVEVIKHYIDYLAMYKMNYFHWHLTDDQGWRIEIKKYPKLQSVSARRNGTLVGHHGDKPELYDSIPYGGFYTQEEVKEIVSYSIKRHITIIPEIEMPGHALSALAAYPEFSCTGGPFEVGKTWGVFKDVFCPKEETFTFLQNVLDEVCELFPGKYIHIGGDECPKDRWKSCNHCQELIKNFIPTNSGFMFLI